MKKLLNQSIILNNNDDFQENDFERLTRKLVTSLIQTYHLFGVKEDSEMVIGNGEIMFDAKEKQFNINPYFMLIKHILKADKGKGTTTNRVLLSNMIERTVEPIFNEFEPHFLSNFNYLIQKLRSNVTNPLKYSSLL